MNELVEGVMSLIVGESGIDFPMVLAGFLIYLVLLWAALCIWVLADARRRYGNFFIGLLIAVVVFILQFPALILYLVVRPEEEVVFEEPHGYINSGVEVPVVKFVGKDGSVKMALNLQISSELADKPDMTLDLGVSDHRQSIEVSARDGGVSDSTMASGAQGDTGFISKMRNKVSVFFASIRSRLPGGSDDKAKLKEEVGITEVLENKEKSKRKVSEENSDIEMTEKEDAKTKSEDDESSSEEEGDEAQETEEKDADDDESSNTHEENAESELDDEDEEGDEDSVEEKETKQDK